MDDREAGGALAIFFQYEESGVVPIGSEGGDFADGEFVGVFVC